MHILYILCYRYSIIIVIRDRSHIKQSAEGRVGGIEMITLDYGGGGFASDNIIKILY